MTSDTRAKQRALAVLSDAFESRGVHSYDAAGEAVYDVERAGVRFVLKDERAEWLGLLAEFLRVTSRFGEPCMLCHRDGATDDDHGEGCEWVRAREILDENGYDTDALTRPGQSG